MKHIARLIALSLALVTARSARGDGAAAEWKKLVGTWKVDAATFNGDDSIALFKDTVLTSEEGKYKVAFAGMNDVERLRSTRPRNRGR